MWIYVCPHRQMNINSKNSRKRSFFMKPKHQYHLSQQGECVFGAQSWKFVQIIRWTLIQKMVEKEVFHMKWKHQYHLSQQEKCFYGVQSCKKRILLYKSMFILIEKWTLYLKMVKREVFLLKVKHQYHLPQRGEYICGTQSWKKRDYFVNSCWPQLENEL